MDKISPKTSFEQWLSPLLDNLLHELMKLSFMKLLLFIKLHKTESLRTLSDCVFSEELQQATRLDSISISQLGRRLSQNPNTVFQAFFLI